MSLTGDMNGKLTVEIDGPIVYVWFDNMIIASTRIDEKTYITFSENEVKIGYISLRKSWLNVGLIEKIKSFITL
jgi:hypothetical protein